MRKRGILGYAVVILSLGLFAIGFGASTALAVDSSSNNYQMTEWEFGSGATIDGCSGSYCAQATIGDPGAANRATSTEFGEVETDEPMLEVIIEVGESNLGDLSIDRTATKTSIVKVRNNFEGGYSLQMMGDPPKAGNHTLATPDTPTASLMGTEQFAINLTANTVPEVGTLPVQRSSVEGEQTIFGEPTTDYNTANLFKYESGDIIAESLLDAGRTDYTISMIINIANTTPSGHYSGDFALFVVPKL